MKKYSLLLVMLLAGCATVESTVDAFLMKFDANEYKLITDLRTNSSLAKAECSDVEKSRKNVERLYHTALSLRYYAEALPHNGPIQKSSVELFDIIDGMNKQYRNSDKVSEVFCKVKLTSVENNAKTMQVMEGSKPK